MIIINLIKHLFEFFSVPRSCFSGARKRICQFHKGVVQKNMSLMVPGYKINGLRLSMKKT